MVILLILLLYLIIYNFIYRLLRPYKEDKFLILGLIEKRMILLQISNALAAIIWISTLTEKNKLTGWILFVYVVVGNLIFVCWWLQNYFGFFRGKLRVFYYRIDKILKLSKMSTFRTSDFPLIAKQNSLFVDSKNIEVIEIPSKNSIEN